MKQITKKRKIVGNYVTHTQDQGCILYTKYKRKQYFGSKKCKVKVW